MQGFSCWLLGYMSQEFMNSYVAPWFLAGDNSVMLDIFMLCLRALVAIQIERSQTHSANWQLQPAGDSIVRNGPSVVLISYSIA